jgi:peptidoglycan/LPS O-acetylase OafA/YrhL
VLQTAPATSVSTTRTRLDSLTGLRWFAAFAVFLHHAGNFGPVALHPVLRYGTHGVTFFFVLSGFVLAWSYRRETTTATFYWRRFARIWPAHIVALLLAIPIFYSTAPDPDRWWVKPFDPEILALSIPVVQAWWTEPLIQFSGNPAAWTLTCEFFFYALFPMLIRPLRAIRARAALVSLGVVATAYVGYWLAVLKLPGSGLTALPLPLVYLPAFVVGILLATAMRDGWTFRVPPVVTYGATGVFVCLCALATIRPGASAIVTIVLGTVPAWMVVLCALMIRPSPRATSTASPPCYGTRSGSGSASGRSASISSMRTSYTSGSTSSGPSPPRGSTCCGGPCCSPSVSSPRQLCTTGSRSRQSARCATGGTRVAYADAP